MVNKYYRIIEFYAVYNLKYYYRNKKNMIK